MSSRILTIGVVLSLFGGPMVHADIEQALAKLERFKVGDGSAVFNESIAELRAKTEAGDLAVWRRLRAIVENPTIPVRARMEVLQLALEKANDTISKDVLTLFGSWSERLPASEKYTPNAETDARIALLGSFVRALRNEPWRRWLGNEAATYDFIERIILRTAPGMDINHHGIEALVRMAGKPKLRRAAAEHIVASGRGVTEHPAILMGLLDESSNEKLRALVRESSDPQRFHFGAAAALAYLGDIGIRPDLEALSASFQKKDRNLGGMLLYYVWQIDVQNPPTKLLEFVAEPPPPDVSVEKRMWAVRRAVELGLPKSEIREAVLKHASLVHPDKKTGVRRGLSSLKALCIEQGVLEPTDLPGVAIAQSPATP